jgi:predicted DNA binding CopG/RHH family protein
MPKKPIIVKGLLGFHFPAPLDSLIQLRAPRRLITAIKQQAAEHGLTASAYVRLAVVERLHCDGAHSDQ